MSQIYYVPRGGTPNDDDVIALSGRLDISIPTTNIVNSMVVWSKEQLSLENN